MEPGWACFPLTSEPPRPPTVIAAHCFSWVLWTPTRHLSACLRSPNVQTFIR